MEKKERFIFGIHAVQEALHADRGLDKVMVKRGTSSELLKKLLGDLRKNEIPVQYVPVEKLNRVTGKNHQGVIAMVSEVSYTDISAILPGVYEAGEDPLILIIDGVSDVRNFGAMARSAACAGAHAIVISSTGSAAINADAIKTSAGALHSIPVCRHDDLGKVVRFLQDSGLRLFAATEKAEESIYTSDMTGPVAIIMGSEERGVSNALLKEADYWISIPMKGSIASLNVSVATGIMLFETLRQRNA